MNIKENETYTIKLNSGEELIAKVTEVKDDYIIVKEPASVALGPQDMGLVPSMFTSEPKADVSINTNSIAMFSVTEEAVKAKYIQATSNIVMPEKKIIMG